MLAGVTDTHALIWFANNQRDKIGESARKIFAAADRRDGTGLVVVPSTVLHEISCLLISNKIQLKSDFSHWVTALDRHGYFQVLDVTADMVVTSHSFQMIKDPFDRLIMGCSEFLKQPLLTADGIITKSNVIEVIWD
ncbi:MAG TPA: PIN domain-containing protein [Candidatus Angelobacter sp.]|jgi:PIN domain nuclease of toxin-antitoxin system|nr:PIN domain-containing protein [Candidatus Angelobacter sp.]